MGPGNLAEIAAETVTDFGEMVTEFGEFVTEFGEIIPEEGLSTINVHDIEQDHTRLHSE